MLGNKMITPDDMATHQKIRPSCPVASSEGSQIEGLFSFTFDHEKKNELLTTILVVYWTEKW